MKPTGQPLDHSNWTRSVWKPATRALGLEGLRIHDLRHTAATLMISAGAHVEAIRRQLGHRSAVITMQVYAHLLNDDADQIPAALHRAHADAAASMRPAAVASEGTRTKRTV